MSSTISTYYVGTDLKFLLELSATGFDQASDDYEIKIECGSRTVYITKDDIVEGSDGNYYLLIDSSGFKSGVVKMVVTAKVPDDDFNEGVRKEVLVQNLCHIKNT